MTTPNRISLPAPALYPDGNGQQPTLLSLLNIVLRHRVAILLSGLFLALLIGGVTLVKERSYTSVASFLPQGGRSSGGLTGLVAQLGVDFSGASAQGTSPAFYADLAHSRQLLGSVATAQYPLVRNGSHFNRTLLEIYGAEGATPARRRNLAIDKLAADVASGFDLRTSVVTISVKSAQPELSRQLAANLLAAMSAFNLENRQSQARAERIFAEQRLGEVRTDLRRAEDDLQGFLQRNRVLGSPDLEAQRERLVREVSLRQTLYATLAQAYEQAKIEEVRDTPVITVVERPEAPELPDPRRLTARTLLGFVVGAVLAIFIAGVGESFSSTPTSSTDARAEFAALGRDAKGDLRHPVRALRRTFSRRPPRLT